MYSATQLNHKLGVLELSILSAISLRKVMLTSQVIAICCEEISSATIRQVQRLLVKLESLRLLISRQYKQAGKGYATNPNIWTITKLGLRVAHYGSGKLARKLRYWSPRVAKHTLEHTLAINATEIALYAQQSATESARGDGGRQGPELRL